MPWVEKWFGQTTDWLMGTALELARLYCCDYLLYLTVDPGTHFPVMLVLWSLEQEDCSRSTIIGIYLHIILL